MSNALLPCLRCGKVLENVFPDAENQPSGGTEFSTNGHYGSTFWDCGDELLLNVCDPCLNECADRLATRRKIRRPVDYEIEPYLKVWMEEGAQ